MTCRHYQTPRMLIIFSLLSLGVAHAEEALTILSPESTREIFAEASAVSGYTLPALLPEFHLIPAKQFIKKVCPDTPACPAAVSEPGKPIMVNSAMDPEELTDRSFFVHEAIHMLQYAAKQITNIDDLSCEEMLMLEKEAYFAQQRYLDHNGQLLRVTSIVTRMSCKNDITLSF